MAQLSAAAGAAGSVAVSLPRDEPSPSLRRTLRQSLQPSCCGGSGGFPALPRRPHSAGRLAWRRSWSSPVCAAASAAGMQPPHALEESQTRQQLKGKNGMQERMEALVNKLQGDICSTLEAEDPSGLRFCSDSWKRGEDAGSYGLTRVLEGGELLEKAAVNVSVIRGTLSEQRAKAISGRGQSVVSAGQSYFAAALSLVLHSVSPLVPTFRSDVRYFEVDDGAAWFGGGADLTPYYIFDEDQREFHRFWRDLCEVHEQGLYAKLKRSCDEYFYLPARKEHRGTGGIFFDDLAGLRETSGEEGLEFAFAFIDDVAHGWMRSYLPIARRRGRISYTDAQRQWQLLRRGRYLEFNLLYDRGVRFGLDTGRIESIMVSAPPLIAWRYNVVPEAGSEEEKLVEILRQPRDWL
eukprot:jgi/Chlat1/3637/Chrsp238S03636